MRSTHYGVWSHERWTPADYDKFLDNYLPALQKGTAPSNVHKSELLRLLDYPIRVYDSDVENEDAKDLQGKHILSAIVFWLFIVMILIGTIYHCVLKAMERAENEEVPIIEEDRYGEEPLSFKNLVLGFSIIRSFERLWNTASRYDVAGLKALRGLKFIACILLGLTSFYYLSSSPLLNAIDMNDNLSKDYGFSHYKACYFIVDLLLWISGVYTGYSVLSSLEALGDSFTFKPLLFTFVIDLSYKFLRLFPLVLISVIYYGWIATAYGQGPIFSEQTYFNTSEIREYWYTYFLFINNIHPKIVHQGMIWGGFFALEIQLFILFFFVIAWIKYHKKSGLAVLGLLWFGSLIAAFFYAKGKSIYLSSFTEPELVIKYMQKPMNKFFPYGFGSLMGILVWYYNNTITEF